MGRWKQARKEARFDYNEKKIKRLLFKQFECPRCGRSGNMISLWGHSISKDQDCDFYEIQHSIDRMKTLVMMISFGIPVPLETRKQITDDLLTEMDLSEILAQPELAALVILSGLGMDEMENVQEPPISDDKLRLGETWNEWDKMGTTDDQDHS